ncbi:MAG: hypothetical protein AAGE94_15145 [Acidobacteriota bacterium]
MIPHDLSPEWRVLIERELETGEHLDWVDRPIPRYFTARSTSLFLFAIPWTGFSLFWIAGAAGFEMPDFSRGAAFFPLFGLPFVLVGLAMLGSPLWTRYKSGRTLYVITDRRAIVFEGGGSTTIRSFRPDALRAMYRKEKRGGIGDVIFEEAAADDDRQRPPLGFLHIRDPLAVERRLVQLVASRADDQP